MLQAIFIKLTCLVTAFSIIGGPMAVYQAFAWSKMLHDRALNQGLVEAIDSTFSGDAPCEHCKKITAIKSQQKEAPEKSSIPEKLEVLSVAKIATKQKNIFLSGSHTKRLGFIYPSVQILQSRAVKCPTPPPQGC